MTDNPYSTDLTDQEWELIRPLLERNQGRHGQQHYSLRRIVDGCFYVLRGGIPCRLLPSAAAARPKTGVPISQPADHRPPNLRDFTSPNMPTLAVDSKALLGALAATLAA